MRALFRIHLLTGVVAMLTTGALLGLNLRRESSVEYQFSCNPITYDAAVANHAVETPCTVWRHLNWVCGWPTTSVRGYGFDNTPIANASVNELRRMPVRSGGCEIFTRYEASFATETPNLYQQYIRTPAQSPTSQYQIQYDNLALNLATALAILFALAASLEWFLRRKINLEPQRTLRPEGN